MMSCQKLVLCFNAKMVQLKELIRGVTTPVTTSFNAKMVQLKAF